MHPVAESLLLLLIALGDLIRALAVIVVPLLPLVAWIAYWLFAVNWVKLRGVLLQGGWIGLFLLGSLAVLVWGTVAPPANGFHQFPGLVLSNFVGKTVFVTVLVCIMFLCGSVQLSGALGDLYPYQAASAGEIGFQGGAAAHGHGEHAAAGSHAEDDSHAAPH